MPMDSSLMFRAVRSSLYFLSFALIVAAAANCGTGSISFVNQPGTGNAQPAGGGTTGNTNTTPTTQAAGLMVGFEYIPASASASSHPVSDTSFWQGDLEAITGFASGSVPAARLAVVTSTSTGVVAQFPQSTQTGISGVSFAATDAFSAMLSMLDNQNAKVILEIEPGDSNVLALTSAVLKQYSGHSSVAGISVDLRYYTRGGKTAAMSDNTAYTLIGIVQAASSSLITQVRGNDGSKMPSGSVQGLTFVYDTANSGSSTSFTNDITTFASNYSPANVGFIIGAQSDRSWACQLSSAPATLIGMAASAGSNVTNIFWSSDTAAQLSPTNTFSCPSTNPGNPNAGTNPNTGTNPNAVTNPNAGTGPNPNTVTNPNSGSGPNPNTVTNPNSGSGPNPNSGTNPNTTNGGGANPNGATEPNQAGNGNSTQGGHTPFPLGGG